MFGFLTYIAVGIVAASGLGGVGVTLLITARKDACDNCCRKCKKNEPKDNMQGHDWKEYDAIF